MNKRRFAILYFLGYVLIMSISIISALLIADDLLHAYLAASLIAWILWFSFWRLMENFRSSHYRDWENAEERETLV